MSKYHLSKKKIVAAGVTVVVFAGSIAVTAFAATNTQNPSNHDKRSYARSHGISGTVSEVTGSTIVLESKTKNATSTPAISYAVDASNAKIVKSENGTTTPITVSQIQSGDTLMVVGTTTAGTVDASLIFDGNKPKVVHVSNNKNAVKREHVMGEVTGVYGGSFTVLTHTHAKIAGAVSTSTQEVTVDTNESTVFKKGGQTDTNSDLAVGQYVLATGTNDSAASVFNATSVNILTAKKN